MARELTSKSAYLALLLTVPVLIVFALLGRWQMGIGAWVCAGLVLVVARANWELRSTPWFWLSLTVSVLLQIPLVLLIPWNNKGLTGISLLPVALLDYGVVYGCVRLAGKMASRS